MMTSLYIGLLGLLYFKISLDTIIARGREKVSLGPGANNEVLHLVSAHGNFSSYAPLFLLMFFLLEQQNTNSVLLHVIGVTFSVGRVLHYLTMKDKERTVKKRKLAMQLTLWPMNALAIINIYAYVMQS
ncbi:MAG: MAPEG family protein [Bdellovibrionales bacterium]|nr:MAPEG family protein [Bdellovibrionales bacterium]